MNPSECIDYINKIENSFPIHELKEDGIELWPIYRTFLGFDLIKGEVNKAPPKTPPPEHWLLKRWVAKPDNKYGFLKATLADRRSKLFPDSETPILFMGDNNTRLDIDGTYYHRICDPLRDTYESLGIRTTHIEPLRSFGRHPRHRASTYVNSFLIQTAEDAFKLAPLPRIETTNLERLKELTYWIERETKLSVYLNEHRTLRIVAQVRRMKRLWLKTLSRIRPQIIYTVLWYNTYGWSVCAAAKELGIPTVELPHGRQDALHHAYGKWSNLPREGYAIMPRCFWTWSDYEFETFNSWSEGSNKHGAFIGGNPIISLWKEEKAPFIKELNTRAQDKYSRLSKSPIILATPQYLTNSITKTIETIKQAPEDWLWLIRLHPLEIDRISDFVQEAKTYGINNYEIEFASTAPLYSILKHVNVHYTGFSSVVYEAKEFGIRSVIMLKHGATIFRDLITNGSFKYSENIEDCISYIQEFILEQDVAKSQDATSLESSLRGLHRMLGIPDLEELKMS